MNSEQRARELLAECLTEFGCDGAGYAVRHKQEEKANLLYPAALRAIARALEQPASAAGFAEFESLMNLVPDEYDPNIAKSEPAQAWVAGFNICRNEVVENIRKRTIPAAPQPATKESR